MEAGNVRVYIIKESEGEREGPGSKRTYRSLAKYRHAAAALRKKRLARRHYSGLNNIMSRGKRGLCNWTRERARSVGSAEETSLPLSLDPVADFISHRVSCYVTANMSQSVAVI